MSKVQAATTGFINNGGVILVGQDNPADTWDYVTLPQPTAPVRIVTQGDVPIDKDGVSVSASIFIGTVPVLSGSGTWGIQGQSSTSSNKKNWKIKFKNPNTGNKLNIRIGGWFPQTSITLKGYGADRTLVRDSLTTELWRVMHSYPSGLLAPFSAYRYFDGSDLGVHTSALFSTAGFPAELWHNGAFLGLYVLRADNDPITYLLDDSNPQHILIQPQHAGDMWSWAFNSTQWDFPSPSVKGYDTGDDMSGLNQTVNDAAARVVNWMNDCVAGRQDFRKTYKQYLDLQSALDFVLINEVSLSFDSLNNNFMMGTRNGTPTSGVWEFYPYDEDEAWGVAWFLGADDQIDPTFGWVADDASINKVPQGQPPGIFKVILEQMRPELRRRWCMLRDAGIISASTITRIVKSQTDLIDPSMMVADIANWPLSAWTGNQQGVVKAAQSPAYICSLGAQRISWIDQQLGYSE
ncbi:CotH kinase family protein [Acetobacter tropicalis]|uniref:CotH kinase family protein n=1 Tax=Acetobacter TaxID=434 RepID=UPI001EDC0756|nr:CotH kinase family protein [Acetobacter senegalensis]MCG4253165.1 CotH kinase family protein [Acetobacter senegalensis]